MKKTIVVGAIIIAVFSGALFFLNRDSKQNLEETAVEPDSENIPDGKKDVLEDWKIYSNDEMGFSMYYDPSLILQEDENTNVRFYKYGPTQKGQTEMYDGIAVSVRKISVNGGGEAYINSQIEQYKDIGTITEPLHDGNLNGVPVKEYSASGLGDYKIIFVPINEQTLLEISYLVPDPTNAGFQKIAERMLSTFTIK